MKTLNNRAMALVGLVVGCSVLGMAGEARATWKCTYAKGVGHDLTAVPQTETITLGAAEQLVLSGEITDADNSITAVEIDVYASPHAVDGTQRLGQCTIVSGSWLCAAMKIEWDPVTDGKNLVVPMPVAYYEMDFIVTVATGAGAGDVLQFRWNICSQ
jgi:hypothetical protein